MIGKPPLDKNTDLLQEIETLSRALSLHTSSNPKLKSTPSSSSSSQRKPSLWNWNPLKALSRIRQRRFDCIFSLHVHSIENLPAALSDAALSVHWKRTSSDSCYAAGTSSVSAYDGVVEFEETLNYRCSVYGTRKGSRDSAAKYEAMRFLIYVLVSDAVEVEDVGKCVVDVTRLLPLTLEELEENRAGKWSTSFRLSGKGEGALLNVSLGFLLIDDGTVMDDLNVKMRRDDGSVGRVTSKGRLRWARSRSRSQSVEDVRVLHEILPSLKSSLSSSLGDAVEKLEIRDCEFDDLCVDEMFKPESVKEPESLMIEQGVGFSAKDQVSGPVFENIDVEAKGVVERFDDSSEYKESRLLCDDNQTTMDDRDFVCDVLSLCEREGLEALDPEFMTPFTKSHHTGVKSEYEDGSLQSNSFGFDDSIEAIASEFFDMLAVDHDPFGLSSESEVESPREQLLKKFEEETLGAGSLLFGLDIEKELYDEAVNEHNLLHEFEDFDLSFMVHEAERELYEATQGLCHFSRSELLDIAETEALMRQWGLNEKEFQCSPLGSTNGFDNPIDLSSELPLKLPPLGDGLGPFVQTKDGGFLRSMRPALFRNSKCNASLIMQVSSPIVVPAEMGIEKPSTLAKKLMMPFEDVTGKTMLQIAWEANFALDTCKNPGELPDLNGEVDVVVIPQKASGRRKKEIILNLASASASDRDSKCVLDKIEALPMEALRIQSGISDLGPQFFGNTPVSGIVIDGDQTSDRTSKFLVAHQVARSNFIAGGWKKQEKTGGKRSGRSWGLLQSNFTVDSVGTPMHIFLTAKPRIHATVSEKGNSEEDETELKPMTKSELILVNGEKNAEEEGISQFEITEVHVAGHATEPNRKNVWCNSVQHQSGLRWLIANGMGKSNKHPFMKSKLVHGTGTKWKEMLAMHAHFQNPSNGFRRRR